MVTENTLSPADLIWPVFVQPGSNEVTPVASMPGVNRDVLIKEITAARKLGIPAIAIFPETQTDPTKNRMMPVKCALIHAHRAAKRQHARSTMCCEGGSGQQTDENKSRHRTPVALSCI